jgi:hypothetical protein
MFELLKLNKSRNVRHYCTHLSNHGVGVAKIDVTRSLVVAPPLDLEITYLL